MTTQSCSHWWHCPIYLAMAVTLAAIAISTSRNSSNSPSTSLSLSSNATLSLHAHDFTSIAILLSLYPQHFLSGSQSTVFAIQDKPFSKLNSHPQFLKQLLKYHSVPIKLPFEELMKNPQGTCFPTLANKNRIGITKIENSTIEINHVAISHPDLFLSGSVAIHGVAGPFSKFNSGEITEPESPFCSIPENETRIGDEREWRKAIRFLSSNGFVSFSIGLNSVLDGVLREYPNLDFVTIFAPMDFGFVSSSWGLLGKIVRYHIVPRRIMYADFVSFPDKSVVKTLVSDGKLVIRVKNVGADRKLGINGVEILAPDAFLSRYFVIHGISRALTMEELPSTSMY